MYLVYILTICSLRYLRLHKLYKVLQVGLSSRCTYVLVLAQQKVFEGVFESDVTQRVAGRVDGAVDVAEPVTDGPEGVWNADGTEGVDEDHHIVGCPRDDKSNQDGHDSARHLFLPGRNTLPSPFCDCTLFCHLKHKSRTKCNE